MSNTWHNRIGWGLGLAGLLWFQPGLSANPISGSAAAGSITMTTNGQTLTILQQSRRAIIDWQDFSIGAGELTKFIQPDATSAVLNRVVSGNPSSLLGNLEANGRVFLLNPNGILVGAGARIDTGGFLASTLDVSNEDFLRGGDLLFRGDSNAAIQNLGTINALGGDIFLIARQIENHGSLAAANGTAGLAAGSEVLLTTGGSERVFVQASSAPGAFLNAGQISATSAELKAAGGNAYALAINNTGVVRATGTAVRGGQIWLVADGGGIASSGTLDASSTTGQGGDIQIAGGRVTLDSQSRLDASGATGGGRMFVLGGAQVAVDGALDARATGGDGGSIETSADRVKVADSTRVNTSAAAGRNGTWLIDPVDFTIAASGGDMTGAAVGAALAGGNFTIQSTNGGAGTAGDVNVNDTVSWSANQLTLNAQNNINLNASLNGSGTASLALEYGQGAVAAGNTGSYRVNAAVNLPAGNRFSTKLGSDGVARNFTVITGLGAEGSTTGMDLQGMAANLAGSYALGADLDASATSGWNSGAGFAPIGGSFVGAFDGLGHTITGLFINRPATTGVGLFGTISNSPTIGSVGNVQLVNVNITGGSRTAALAGALYGPVTNCSSTGSVTGTSYVGGLVAYDSNSAGVIAGSHSTATVNGTNYVGGLVGFDYLGPLSDCYATGAVSATAATSNAGGLVGYALNAGITNAHSTGTVTGQQDTGGLAGYFSSSAGSSSITGSYSTSPVSGTTSVGGLVGLCSSAANGTTTITTSHSTGSVGGTNYVGGFIGQSSSTGNGATSITSGYSTSPTTSTGSFIGGFIGRNNLAAGGSIAGCYSTGTVTNGSFGGGFIGYNNMPGGTITNSYSTSAVNEPSGAGFIMLNSAGAVANCFSTGLVTGNNTGGGGSGFIAQNSGTVTNCYSTGATVGDGSSGFIGINNASGVVTNCYSSGAVGGTGGGGFVRTNSGTVTNSFWDTQTSGYATSSGGTGMTTVQMQSLADFTSATAANGNVNPAWDFTAVWRMYDGYTYPLLKSFLTPLTVTANAAVRTYDGTAYSGGNGVTYSATPSAALLGTLAFAGNSQGARNAGSYAIVPTGLYSGQFGYDITVASGALTIDPAPLTITADSKSKSPGVANPPLTATYAGLISGETAAVVTGLTLNTTATLASPTGSYPITPSGATSPNYAITSVNGVLTVVQNTLTITADDKSATYGAGLPAFTASYAGFINGDTPSVVTGLQFSTSAIVGSSVGTYEIMPFGATAASYTLAYMPGTLTIDPAALIITADNASRLYSAANPAFTASYSGLVGGDTPAVVSGLQFDTVATAGSNAGIYAITPSGASAANYSLSFLPGMLTVNPAPLTITANSANRFYGAGNPAFTASFSGLVNGDTPSAVTGLTLGTAAAAASPAGAYAITASGAIAPNYALTFVDGLLTVGKRPLTVTADDKSKIYGAALPAFTASFSGLVNGDTPSAVTGLQFDTAATAGSNVGTYAITPSGGSAANYTLSFLPGTLTINPASLTITAVDASRLYGADNPAFTASYSGLVNGDTSAVVTGLQFATTAGTAARVGSYPITPWGASASNYALTFVPGALNVTVPCVMVNDAPVAVMTVDRIPMLTGAFAVAEIGDRCMLVPASRACVEASLDAALTGTLSEAGRRAVLPGFSARSVLPGESHRPGSMSWMEELAAARRLAARAITLSSSYDASLSRDNPDGSPRIAGSPR